MWSTVYMQPSALTRCAHTKFKKASLLQMFNVNIKDRRKTCKESRHLKNIYEGAVCKVRGLTALRRCYAEVGDDCCAKL
jgi:hypothetical protein